MAKKPTPTEQTLPAQPGGTDGYFSDEFYIEGTEPREDAALHADMLEGPHAEEADRIFALRSAIRLVEEDGVDEEVAASLYGISREELNAAADEED